MLRGSSVKIEIKTELFSLKLREQRGKSSPMVLSGKSFTSFECSVDITELTVWDRCLSSWDPQLPLPSVPQLPALSALLLEIPNALMFFMHLEESCGAALPPTDRALACRTALPLSPLSWFIAFIPPVLVLDLSPPKLCAGHLLSLLLTQPQKYVTESFFSKCVWVDKHGVTANFSLGELVETTFHLPAPKFHENRLQLESSQYFN